LYYASQYAVQGEGLLLNWFQEVRRSALVSELISIRGLFPFMSDEWNEVQYLLDVAELWARSYEQFIGTNTQDAQLQDQFRQASRRRAGASFLLPSSQPSCNLP
jgi:hypothetical protein